MWDMRRIRRIDLEITSFCNIKCSGCSRETTVFREDFKDKEIMSLETIQQKFRKEDWPGLKIVNFCGSVDEPTTHPQFFDIIKFFKEWDVFISISTNGSIRSEKWWTELAEILKDHQHNVIWGIDGIDETSEIYRKGSKFVKVQKNFRAFNKAGGKSAWQFIVFEHNKHQLPFLEDIAKKEGFVKTTIINSARGDGADPKIQPVRFITKETPEIECRYLNEGLIFINHLGDVIPCCYWNSDQLSLSSPNYVIKDIPQHRYSRMWRDHGGPLATNLKYNEIKDVVEGDFFQSIVESWSDGSQILNRCEHFCKKKNQSVIVRKEL